MSNTSGWEFITGELRWSSVGRNNLLWKCQECGRADARHPSTPADWVGDGHIPMNGIGWCGGRREKAHVDALGNFTLGEHPDLLKKRG